MALTQQLAAKERQQLAERGRLGIGESAAEQFRQLLYDWHGVFTTDRRNGGDHDAYAGIAEPRRICLKVLGHTGRGTTEQDEELRLASGTAYVGQNLGAGQKLAIADFKNMRAEVLVRVHDQHEEIRRLLR